MVEIGGRPVPATVCPDAVLRPAGRPHARESPPRTRSVSEPASPNAVTTDNSRPNAKARQSANGGTGIVSVTILGRYDAIVVGVGGMGSATVYELARRGKRVLGLERFDIPHDMGSSHGHTRIIRLAYYEHPSYVMLLRRAYELWREIQGTAGEKLLHITGSVDAGPADSWVFKGSLQSCKLHDLPHEVLTGAELRRRFPGYQLPAEHLALLQPEGGFLMPERCIVSYVEAAQALGAEIHGRERVLEWEPLGGRRARPHRPRHVRGRPAGDHRRRLERRAAGLLEGLAVPERQVLAWLQPSRPELFRPSDFPVFNLLVDEGRFYGFPVIGVPGFKFGRYHHLEEIVDPDEHRPRAARPRRAGAARLRRALLPRWLRADDGPADLHVHQHARPPLHHRPAPATTRRSRSPRPARATASSSPA